MDSAVWAKDATVAAPTVAYRQQETTSTNSSTTTAVACTHEHQIATEIVDWWRLR